MNQTPHQTMTLSKLTITLLSLTLFIFLSCSKPEIVAEYHINWKKCSNGNVKLFSDSSYQKACDHREETGAWFFKSVNDSVLCLKKDENMTTTTNVIGHYFIQNDMMHPLESAEVIATFDWTLGKRGPSWILSDELDSHTIQGVQIISSVDSSVWHYAYKGDDGNFHLTLTGYYFLEDQPGISAGGSEYEARAFLALENNNNSTSK